MQNRPWYQSGWAIVRVRADEAVLRSMDAAVEEAVCMFETRPAAEHDGAVESLGRRCMALRAALRGREDRMAQFTL